MNYTFKSSFDRCYKKLPPIEQDAVDKAIKDLKKFFSNDVQKEGLGLKRLWWKFWEIRASIKIRLLFLFEGDNISFVIVGNHDDIRKYLESL